MKNYLFVDGSNLYGGQYELFGPDKYLDFCEFVKNVEIVLELKFNRVMFYASYSPIPKRPSRKVKQYLKNEACFYNSVRKCRQVIFFKGYRSTTSGKEKEVDVKLAVDMVDFGYRNCYDNLFLISGDADFMQALNVVGKMRKKIKIISLENRIPYRFSYFYETIVIRTRQETGFELRNSQKIKLIAIDKKKMVRET